MRVALVMLLAGGAAGLHVPPTQAATQLTLFALQSDVVEGDEVVFRGFAPGSRPGAVVALQRLVAGSWTRVDRLRLGHRDRFHFTTAPQRGRHRYRVKMLRQVGQRLSPSAAVTVVVRWRPDLRDMAATYGADAASGEVRVAVTGRVPSVPDGTRMTRQHFDGTAWVWAGSATITDHRWRDAFTTSYGTRYRYTMAAAGLRLRGVSAVMTAIGRAELAVDATTEVAFRTDERHLAVALEAGQTYTYAGPYWVTPRLTGPTGEPVHLVRDSGGYWFQAPVTGTYAVDLTGNPAEEQPARVTLSRPVVVASTLDAPALDLTSSLPNQWVDLTFEAAAGAYVSERDAAPYALVPDEVDLLDPHGEKVPLLFTLDDDGSRVWRLPEVAGRYTLRVNPGSHTVDMPDVEVLSVVERTMPVDAGAATTVDFDRPGRVAVLDTLTPAGADVSFTSSPARFLRLMAPDGTRVYGNPSVVPTQEGVYRAFVAAPDPGSVDFFASSPVSYDAVIDGAATPFDHGPVHQRDALLRIPAEEGDVFSVHVTHPDGTSCLVHSYPEPSSSAVAVWRRHPLVVLAQETGTVVARLTPCQQKGWFSVRRITPVAMEPRTDVRGSQSRATFVKPGDVAVLLLDAGPEGGAADTNGVTFSVGASDLTDYEGVTFAVDGRSGYFDWPMERLAGQHAVVVWGGPRATGWVDFRARW